MFSPRVETQNQILGHSVPVAGTPFHLHYRSDRVPGRRAAFRLSIPLRHDRVPRGVTDILLEVHVAGQRFQHRTAPDAAPPFTFHWNGTDAAGHVVPGKQSALIRLGYVYRAAYPRPALTRWQERRLPLGVWDARLTGLSGWTLSPHHTLDRVGHVLYFGTGRRRSRLSLDDRAGDLLIPDLARDEVYIFDQAGRHLRTVHALTGGLLYLFRYDPAGRLDAVEDADGNRTQIERDSRGAPTALVGPWGARTTLATDPDGYLAAITNPLGHTVRCTYADGLLTQLTDPRGAAYHARYDTDGLLLATTDPLGATTTFARTEDATGRLVVRLSPEGRESTYRSTRTADGHRLLARCCGSGELEVVTRPEGGQRIRYPEGTVLEHEPLNDPRWGALRPTPKRATVTLPSGIQGTVAVARAVEPVTSTSPLRVKTWSETVDINGARHNRRYEDADRLIIERSPEGRERRTRLDERGRVLSIAIAGLEPIRYGYDVRGRLEQITNGERMTRIAYDEGGRGFTLTDPLGHSMRHAYDAAGRLKTVTLADDRTVEYEYDTNGNLVSLTTPGGARHEFTYTAVNMTEAYRPPAVGPDKALTRYTYNADRQLAAITRPDGRSTGFDYSAAGHASTVRAPDDYLRIEYEPEAARLKQAVTASGDSLSVAYDGTLWKRVQWLGTVNGAIERTFDVNFRSTTIGVQGGRSISERYDADGLLVEAGALQLARSPEHGLLTATVLREVRTAHEYTELGELRRVAVSGAARELFVVEYERDAVGRITGLAETVDGRTRRCRFTYDRTGQLVEASDDDGESRCEYDGNGNRTRSSGPLGEQHAEFDAQDRLLRYAGAMFTHTAAGERASKTTPDGTTAYDYDAWGNLRRVQLADGTTVEYVVDGANRRIGKKVNGRLAQGWLYQDSLKPIAEVDATNSVVSRFVYATRVNVPDYMERDGVTYRIVTDHIGSVRLVLDAETGEVAQRLRYDVWGRVVEDTRPGFQPFGFAGGLYDAQTGLVRFGARDYDAETGRWTAKDPIRFAGSTNLYAYAGNDPVNRIDPRGLQDEGPGIAVSDTSGGITVTVTARPRYVPDISDPLNVVVNSPTSGGNGRRADDPGRVRRSRGPIQFDLGIFRCAVGYQGRDVFDQTDTAPGTTRDPWTGDVGPQNPARPTEGPGTGGGVRFDVEF